MVDGLGGRDVLLLVVDVLMMGVVMEVMGVSLLLMEVLGVVDEDDEGAVEVVTDAEFVDADVEIVAVNSVEVLPGVALENVESDEEETPLVDNDGMVVLGLLENVFDDLTLDGKEALLGDVELVGKIEVFNVLLDIVDVLVVLVGTTELGAPTLEVVSVLKFLKSCSSLMDFRTCSPLRLFRARWNW